MQAMTDRMKNIPLHSSSKYASYLLTKDEFVRNSHVKSYHPELFFHHFHLKATVMLDVSSKK